MRDTLIARNIPHEGAGLFEDVFAAEHLSYDIVELGRVDGLPPPSNYQAMLIFGGLDSANDPTLKVMQQEAQIRLALEYDIPFLGICLAHQVMAKVAGGVVVKSNQEEVGFTDQLGEPYTVTLTQAGKESSLLRSMPDTFQVFELHSEEVREVIQPVELLATGKHTRNQIIQIRGRRAYGLQCHLELTETMLAQWADEEPYLASFDKNQLLADFEVIQTEYTTIGQTLIRNFLRVAELI